MCNKGTALNYESAFNEHCFQQGQRAQMQATAWTEKLHCRDITNITVRMSHVCKHSTLFLAPSWRVHVWTLQCRFILTPCIVTAKCAAPVCSQHRAAVTASRYCHTRRVKWWSLHYSSSKAVFVMQLHLKPTLMQVQALYTFEKKNEKPGGISLRNIFMHWSALLRAFSHG